MENFKRKIGLMGWHSMYNFGSQLQLTALSQVIMNMGFSSEVINYTPKNGMYREKRGMCFLMNWIFRKLLYKCNPEYLSEKKKHLFEVYKSNHFSFSVKCDLTCELYMLNERYDAFVCGSDQIWNPYIGDDKYFLDFVKDSSKKIAYAPSFGVDILPNNYVEDKYYKLLKDFGAVSVREIQGKELLNKIGIRDVSVVLDPTLLLSEKQWNNLLQINCKKSEEYILCYFLGDIRKHLRYINYCSQKLHKKVVVIAAREKDVKLPYQIYCDIGPKEFVELIHHACFVCTDSFHGVCFSIIYQKNFCVFERFRKHDNNNQNSRIDSILKILDLEQCKVCDGKFSDIPFHIKWEECKKKLNQMIKKSFTYLHEALNQDADIAYEDQMKNTNLCCGCGACKAVCKLDAIEILEDNNGNLKAKVNNDTCVHCGKCKKVCPFLGVDNLRELKETRYFSFQSKSKEVLSRSSSGGASFEILQYLFKQGYLIFGCIYDNKSERAVHKCVGNDEIYKTQGSKYLQSNTVSVMKEIVQAKEKLVFVGTPCQVSAIDKILRECEMRDKAVLIDFVCHGVPSNYLWYKYLKEVKTKLCISETSAVVFREKKYGWRKRVMMITGDNGKIFKKSESKDMFYCFYKQGNCNSDQCYECCFKGKTAADIRLGDYWGKRYKNDKKGVSRVFAVTAKGDQLIYELKGQANIEVFPVEQFFFDEKLLNLPKPLYYSNLIRDLQSNELSLKSIKKKYCDAWYIEYLYKLKDFIKRDKAEGFYKV